MFFFWFSKKTIASVRIFLFVLWEYISLSLSRTYSCYYVYVSYIICRRTTYEPVLTALQDQMLLCIIILHIRLPRRDSLCGACLLWSYMEAGTYFSSKPYAVVMSYSTWSYFVCFFYFGHVYIVYQRCTQIVCADFATSHLSMCLSFCLIPLEVHQTTRFDSRFFIPFQ